MTGRMVDGRDGGLSPRVRGNHTPALYAAGNIGSIPACAGEPVADDGGQVGYGVYPRVCGGTAGDYRFVSCLPGLSPRVRGNRIPGEAQLGDAGSIPACAGEPRRCLRIRSNGEVYPRVCGGTALPAAPAGQAGGLSPRVRGNHAALASDDALLRSIPACAGEPPGLGDDHSPGGVYPRVCGGTPRAVRLFLPGTGLSPRVRGNPYTEQQRTG